MQNSALSTLQPLSAEHVFSIRGMDCASCARNIESGVAQLEGVQSCELSFTTARLRVRGTIARAAIIQRVQALGYQALEPESSITMVAPTAGTPALFDYLWARMETRLALLGALLLLPGVILHEILGWEATWINLLALLAMALTIGPIARSAWRTLRVNRELNINALMTIAAIGAVVIGAHVEAGLVMVLFTLGEALEGYTSSRARHAIQSLLELVPQTALRLSNSCCGTGCEERVAISELRPGDLIIVRPGERIPIDGLVHAGASAVNQAPITGESRLIEKQAGAQVFGGSVNGEGVLEISVTQLAEDTTLARMIRLVQQAQERRAPVQRVVDQFAKYYTPAVVLLALLLASLPPLLFGWPFWNPGPDEFGWLYRGLALLVVACPCALVISTPVSLVSAMSTAARNGVLIKGGAFLEALSRVRAVAFDKTGTLTRGQPAVVAVRSAACQHNAAAAPGHCDSCNQVLALAGAVERRSEHPLAHAIVTASSQLGLDRRVPAAEGVTALLGRGVVGRVGEHEVLIGSHRHFDAMIAHDPQHCIAAEQDAAAGHTAVMVGVQGSYIGTITLADTVRSSSQAAVAALKRLGLRAIVMLTGDQQASAERIAASVGVSEIRAELLPEQKVAAIEALQRRYGPVAMVGDGINDTPALATASVGIAIGGAHGGSNQAMETADITLMSDDLRQLPFAISLSRASMRTVGVNIGFSIAIKLVFLVLVLLGLGSMWLAVLADMGTSLLVTLNGMRLLGYRGGLREMDNSSAKELGQAGAEKDRQQAQPKAG